MPSTDPASPPAAEPHTPASLAHEGVTTRPADGGYARPSARKRLGRSLGLLVLLAAAAATLYAATTRPEAARRVAERLGLVRAPQTPPAPPRTGDPGPPPWDGRITIARPGVVGIGIVTTRVKAQTEPFPIELPGTTAYDDDNLSKIRPMFRARVDKVHFTIGQTVHKGDALIDLYSKELAEAKRQYEIERIQWVHDHNLLLARENLLKTSAISQNLYLETANAELKSRREMEIARDSLFVFGLSEDEIGRVEKEVGAQKARMTLRAPAEGIVIERDAVAGNLYDENDTLMTIAPDDRLWVWGHVFESDLSLVHMGQEWEIHFSYLEETVMGKILYVSNRVDPASRSVKIRTTIPNPEGRLKADMLVRTRIRIPPVPGRTVIPRSAVVVTDGHNYRVFVRVPAAGDGLTFERRTVSVAHEKDDFVVVGKGLEPDTEVATVGALVLNHIFEDRELAHAPAPRPAAPPIE